MRRAFYAVAAIVVVLALIVPFISFEVPDQTTIVVSGMGRVGTSAYDEMHDKYGDTVLGVDSDPLRVIAHANAKRNVVLGDPSDADFWDRVQKTHTIRIVLLALPQVNSNLAVLRQLHVAGFDGSVAATARFPKDADTLRKAGVDTVYDIYTEAGVGFAAHVDQNIEHDAGRAG